MSHNRLNKMKCGQIWILFCVDKFCDLFNISNHGFILYIVNQTISCNYVVASCTQQQNS